MCGCDEPDDAAPAGPSLALPPEMAIPNYQRTARISREWCEVFPGLQGRLGTVDNGPLCGATAAIAFRLAPLRREGP
jgi:hypothetical protein